VVAQLEGGTLGRGALGHVGLGAAYLDGTQSAGPSRAGVIGARINRALDAGIAVFFTFHVKFLPSVLNSVCPWDTLSMADGEKNMHQLKNGKVNNVSGA